jgi:FKBP-type peptidyl-prolyl cis-trans isomerase
VISAWDVGFLSMRVGERAILSCDAAHGYGAAGAGGVIPPDAPLAFDVELLSVGAPPAGGGGCEVA